MKLLFPLLFLVALVSSCVSQKEVTYFQADVLNKESGQIDIQPKYIPQLKPGDILSIHVSSLSPEASAMFNPYNLGSVSTPQQTAQTTSPAPATGFLIDENGYITLPLAGKL